MFRFIDLFVCLVQIGTWSQIITGTYKTHIDLPQWLCESGQRAVLCKRQTCERQDVLDKHHFEILSNQVPTSVVIEFSIGDNLLQAQSSQYFVQSLTFMWYVAQLLTFVCRYYTTRSPLEETPLSVYLMCNDGWKQVPIYLERYTLNGISKTYCFL